MLKHWLFRCAIVVILALSGVGCRSVGITKDMVMTERTMVTTGYCKCGICCGWERNWVGTPIHSSGSKKGQRKKIGLTASGETASHGTIAADSKYRFGTVMYIPGYGYGRVEDRGGAIKGNHIDLYFKTHEAAKRWGKQTKRIKIWSRGSRR